MNANEHTVIEQRGCSIEYQVFEGTLEECDNYISHMLKEQCEDYRKPSYERELFSGADRDRPFTYIVS